MSALQAAFGDRGTLPTVAAAAVGVVVVTAILFSLVGLVRGDESSADVAAPAASTAPVDDGAAADDGDGDGAAAPAAGSEDDSATEDESDDSAADDDSSAEESTGEETAAEDDGTATDDGAASEDETASEEESSAPDVDPGSVSIQVLDAAGDGGGAAAATAQELRDAGFDVIVINGASRGYDATTVFWSEGQGPGGRAVAAALGTDEARRTPDEVRLSDSVDVHVVVGADRA